MVTEDMKPMLDTSEMIKHLKEKGVKFEIVSEEDAYNFLERNNNYFKLTAYRKNFEVYPSGEKNGQYINLDFAALKELSTLDMRLRYILIHMCLDIEHAIKVDLIRMVQLNNKDEAYGIIREFIANQQKWRYLSNPAGTEYIDSILKDAKRDVYRKNLVDKYSEAFPIWAFAEIIHFSDLIELYMFVKCQYICKDCTDVKPGERFPKGCYPIKNGEHTAYRAFKIVNKKENSNVEICPRIRKQVEQLDRLLQDVRHLRNAAAHNSCFLNDLRTPAGTGEDDQPSPIVIDGFNQIMPDLERAIPGINIKRMRTNMKNVRIRQLYSVLYAHRYLVQSRGIKENRWKELKEFTNDRLYRNSECYKNCNLIVKTFEVLQKTVDIWSEI